MAAGLLEPVRAHPRVAAFLASPTSRERAEDTTQDLARDSRAGSARRGLREDVDKTIAFTTTRSGGSENQTTKPAQYCSSTGA